MTRYEIAMQNRKIDLERERMEMQEQGRNIKQATVSHPHISPKLPAFTEKGHLGVSLPI